ncbi:MAG: MBL fold metallo-hydrolase [Phycisphaerae bacterium]|nr:MBL fold metallo-hydrolase [Phycisphaerae bacterium]
MSVKIEWLGHASFKISGSKTVYIDPWKLSAPSGSADIVIVSHSHYDHCSPEDVRAVRTEATTVLAPPDCAAKLGKITAASPGKVHEIGGAKVEIVPAYNIGKEFHPKANDWIGAVVEMDGVRVYYAGDTDQIPEMGQLREITVALLPVGGTYTMNADQAAAAVKVINPGRAVPYHWGDIVGDHGDAEAFKAKATCDVSVLSPGGSLTI